MVQTFLFTSSGNYRPFLIFILTKFIIYLIIIYKNQSFWYSWSSPASLKALAAAKNVLVIAPRTSVAGDCLVDVSTTRFSALAKIPGPSWHLSSTLEIWVKWDCEGIRYYNLISKIKKLPWVSNLHYNVWSTDPAVSQVSQAVSNSIQRLIQNSLFAKFFDIENDGGSEGWNRCRAYLSDLDAPIVREKSA